MKVTDSTYGMTRKHWVVGAVLSLFCLICAPPAFAVHATVNASCAVHTNDLAFGTYNPLGTGALDSQTTVGVECTKTTAYTVALSYGIHGGNAAARLMQDTNGNQLQYNLFADAGRTQVWNGTCTGGNTCASGTGTGPGTAHIHWFDVYGEVPHQNGIVPGQYSDTITVSVTFN